MEPHNSEIAIKKLDNASYQQIPNIIQNLREKLETMQPADANTGKDEFKNDVENHDTEYDDDDDLSKSSIENDISPLQIAKKLVDQLDQIRNSTTEASTNIEVDGYFRTPIGTKPKDRAFIILEQLNDIISHPPILKKKVLEVKEALDAVIAFIEQVRVAQHQIEQLQSLISIKTMALGNQQTIFTQAINQQQKMLSKATSNDFAALQNIQEKLAQLTTTGSLINTINKIKINDGLKNFVLEQLEQIPASLDDEGESAQITSINKLAEEIIEIQGYINQLAEMVEKIPSSSPQCEYLNNIIKEQQTKLNEIITNSTPSTMLFPNIQTALQSAITIARAELQCANAKQTACAYAKLAYAVNAVNDGLRSNFIGRNTFEREVAKLKTPTKAKGREDKKYIKVEKGGKRDIWAIFNTLLQNEVTKQLKFDEQGNTTIVVGIGGRVFEASIHKLNTTELHQDGKLIDGKFDIQLKQYAMSTDGVLTLGTEFFRAPIRIGKKGNLLIASDSLTGARVVRDQYMNYNHQVDAMLRTFGLEMDTKGAIHDFKGLIPESKLIVAGTGSGKSGIIATTAMALGRGVFVTQSSLVDNMVKDVNDFVKNETGTAVAVKLPPDLSQTEFVSFLKNHPYTAMSHDQLMLYAGVLQDQNIFIDEIHSVVPKSYDSDSQEKMAFLEGVLVKNKVFGATATPTRMVDKLFKGRIYDLPLCKAQKELKTVREIATNDIAVESDSLAKSAVDQLLTRRAILQPGMRGYVLRPPQRNIRLSLNTQGLVFTDDVDTAREIHRILSNKDSVEGIKTGLYDQVIAAQNKTIDANVKIDIILNLGTSNETKKTLQNIMRNGGFSQLDEIYQNAVKEYLDQQNKKKITMERFKNQVEKSLNPTNLDSWKGLNNFTVLMQDYKFKELYFAYKNMVKARCGESDPKQQTIINTWISYINNGNYVEAFKLFQQEEKTRDPAKLDKTTVDTLAKLKRPLSKTFNQELVTASRLKPEIKDLAIERKYKWLMNNPSFKVLYDTYIKALKKNHRRSDEETKKAIFEKAEREIKELVKAGNYDAIKLILYTEVEKSYVVNWEYKRELEECPALQTYYATVKEYFEATKLRQAVQNVTAKLQATSEVSALLLEIPRDELKEKTVKALLEKGLIMHVVSTGPLGTGYSNPNILSTVVVQKHSIEEASPSRNPVSKRVQQCGRPIRDDDGTAFGSSVTNIAIPEEGRNLTFQEVYYSGEDPNSKSATDLYMEKNDKFEEYCIKSITRIKELYEQLETLKKLPSIKNDLNILTLIDDFDSDIRARVIEIDKMIKEAPSPPISDAWRKRIDTMILGLNADSLIAKLQDKTNDLAVKDVLKQISNETTKLKDQLTGKLSKIYEKQATALSTIHDIFMGYKDRKHIASMRAQKEERMAAEQTMKAELEKIKKEEEQELERTILDKVHTQVMINTNLLVEINSIFSLLQDHTKVSFQEAEQYVDSLTKKLKEARIGLNTLKKMQETHLKAETAISDQIKNMEEKLKKLESDKNIIDMEMDFAKSEQEDRGNSLF